MISKPKISEAEFQTTVVELATLRGWLVHHTRAARTQDGWRTPLQGHKGFPDLVLARAGNVIFAELKSEIGRLSHEQQAWAAHLPPDSYYLWRPCDFDTAVDILR